MKFCLLLVIGASAIALSAGRRDHKDHGPHGHKHSEESYESLDSFRENSRLCESGFLGCVTPFFKYNKRYFNETLDLIRNAGAQEICREALEAKNCVAHNLAEPVCRNIPAADRKDVNQTFNLIDYVCIDKFTELEEHWDCATDINILEQFGDCERKVLFSRPATCNDTVTGFSTCVIEVVNANCKAGAEDLVAGLLERSAKSFFYRCRDEMKTVKSLKHYWNRKY